MEGLQIWLILYGMHYALYYRLKQLSEITFKRAWHFIKD